MDIKKCKLFVLTAETGKISKTAELTGYTQSGVSHILKSLEKEVEIQLFVRDRYGVHLTPLGADLLMYVKRFLAENERLEQFLYDLRGIEIGSIKIGTYTSVSNTFLPFVLKKFTEVHPNIEVHINEGGYDELIDWIDNLEIDLLFCSNQPSLEHDFIHLYNDPMVAILPPGCGESFSKGGFPIEELNGKPFILSETGIDHDIERILKQNSINPQILFSCKSDSTILRMVEAGLGFSILPQLSCRAHPGNFITLPLEPDFSRDLGIAVRSINSAPPIVRSFIYAAQDCFREYIQTQP